MKELSDIVHQAKELETKGGRTNYEKAEQILTQALDETKGMPSRRADMLNIRGG